MSETEAKAKPSEESKPLTNEELTRKMDVLEKLSDHYSAKFEVHIEMLELEVKELKQKISAMEIIQEMYAINITPTRVENDTEQALNL